jgi:hypothetical protein
LGAGRLRGFGGVFRVLVDVGERKIAEGETEAVAQALLDGLDDGIGFPAIWTLVIAVLNQREGRVNRPLNSSSAARMPSAPGLTPTGET